jgi:hypothetical protein
MIMLFTSSLAQITPKTFANGGKKICPLIFRLNAEIKIKKEKKLNPAK